MNKYKINTKGMSCNACTNRVEKALYSLDKVIFAKADYTNNTVVVETSLDLKAIEEVIEDCGFDVEK